jgi:methionine synthase II (cobalamin-independent)
MAIKTLVQWAPGQIPPEAVLQIIADKLNSLVAAGVTTGLFSTVDTEVQRTWTTQESAQDWIDFLNSLENPPGSAVVVVE